MTIVLTIVALTLTAQVVLAAIVGWDKNTQAAPDRGEFLWNNTYRVETLPDSGLAIRIHSNLGDPAAVSKYLELNKEQAQRLVSKDQGDWVFTTVTFASPLSWNEVTELREGTGLVVDTYTFATLNRGGHKAIIGAVADGNSQVDFHKLRDIARQQGVEIKGVMLLQGKIRARPEGLGRLLADDRICIADVIAAEVLEAIADQPEYQSASYIDVVVSSPFWDMKWD
ncbi:MAG: hypothetical protein SVX38_04315 [Chloroflexota bacterium]|nr:hypothetical protein [Chloroflexota bacterium]